MGLYDREYARGPEPGFHLSAPQSATVQLVLLTVAVYVAQLAFPQVTQWLSLEAEWWRRPRLAYQLLTYGFLHDPDSVEHIAINMLVFWMFGREIEARYGRAEFVAFYLTAIVFAGLVWSLIETAVLTGSAAGGPVLASMLGASGGIAGVFALFALNFPHRRVLFMFVIPMPMWVAALIGLAYDANGAMHRSGDVAFTAHLAGAAFGLAYYWFNWRFAPWLLRGRDMLPRRATHGLRVHAPDDPEPVDDLSVKVDAILQKIQEQGTESLTWSERRLLERASREYQQKRK